MAPILLFLGRPPKHETALWQEIQSKFTVAINTEPDRASFIRALNEGRFGNFKAILKPMVEYGNEPGPWNEELIQHLHEGVKIFAAGGAGYESVDVETLGRRGIYYCNCPDAGTDSTSDINIFHIISLFRQTTKSILTCHTNPSPEAFEKNHNETALTSLNPRGKVLGIVGFGAIGRMTALKCYKLWDMEVWYCERVTGTISPEEEKSLIGANGRGCTSISELAAKKPDIVCVCVPYMPSTHHLISTEFINSLPQGCRLINSSRGPVADEQALLNALERKHLGGLGLDVHEHEPQVNTGFWKYDNVTLTSHIGGVSINAHTAFERTSMENILEVFYGSGTPKKSTNSRAVEECRV